MILRYVYGGRLSLKEYDTSDIIKILEIMIKEPEKVFNSINFNSISEKCLVSLIQHENSQMNVIQVWEKVLKWDHDCKSHDKSEQNTIKEISLKNIDSHDRRQLKK
ncbi:BTB/POZ protein [Rhizophagus clarus]|uniref:BTB/POZ protein n=1 Tax=Rhizophagus clarus TaxID=94130 RepID=A0A8H3LAA8_9GLOM|nr:BTB/POZ protein [Rhizophagus clarus]